MQNLWKYLKEVILTFSIMLISLPALAGLPTPPSGDIPTDSQDWLDVGGSMMSKAIKIGCVTLGAIILVGAASGIIKAYHIAHEKQDLGHFFKMLIVGLIAAAIGLGLVYAGYTIVNSQ